MKSVELVDGSKKSMGKKIKVLYKIKLDSRWTQHRSLATAPEILVGIN
jgi:hypothetical protein